MTSILGPYLYTPTCCCTTQKQCCPDSNGEDNPPALSVTFFPIKCSCTPNGPVTIDLDFDSKTNTYTGQVSKGLCQGFGPLTVTGICENLTIAISVQDTLNNTSAAVSVTCSGRCGSGVIWSDGAPLGITVHPPDIMPIASLYDFITFCGNPCTPCVSTTLGANVDAYTGTFMMNVQNNPPAPCLAIDAHEISLNFTCNYSGLPPVLQSLWSIPYDGTRTIGQYLFPGTQSYFTSVGVTGFWPIDNWAGYLYGETTINGIQSFVAFTPARQDSGNLVGAVITQCLPPPNPASTTQYALFVYGGQGGSSWQCEYEAPPQPPYCAAQFASTFGANFNPLATFLGSGCSMIPSVGNRMPNRTLNTPMFGCDLGGFQWTFYLYVYAEA